MSQLLTEVSTTALHAHLQSKQELFKADLLHLSERVESETHDDHCCDAAPAPVLIAWKRISMKGGEGSGEPRMYRPRGPCRLQASQRGRKELWRA